MFSNYLKTNEITTPNLRNVTNVNGPTSASISAQNE